MLHGLRLLLCGACLVFICARDAEAGAWRAHQFAGFGAFDGGDMAGAVEHFEAALALAAQDPAAARDMGAILENLATAYHAAGRESDAWDALGQWDRILEKHAGEDWAPGQQAFRDLLADFTTEDLGEIGGNAGLPNGASPHATLASGAPASGAPGDYAIHLASLGAQSNVESSWHKLNAAYPTQLTGRSLVVKPVDLGDRGTFKRILAAPFADLVHAELACSELKALGQYCAALPLD